MSPRSQLNPDNLLHFLHVRGAPASTNEIASGLHLEKGDRRQLFKMLAKLKKRRAIEELPGGRYRLPDRKPEQKTLDRSPRHNPEPARHVSEASRRDEIKGRLVLHHDGYGFVVPEKPMPQLDGDVFIPRDAVGDAMHGDQVLVKLGRVAGLPGSQRAEGRIVRILGRAHPSVVGSEKMGA